MREVKRQQLRIELQRGRHVSAPLHELTPRRRAILEETPIDVFFSRQFLEWVFGSKLTRGGFAKSGPVVWHCIKVLWPDVKTVGDLVKKRHYCCGELADLSGFGRSSLILLVDTMAAFGYDFPYDPDRPLKDETEEDVVARKLGKQLGLPPPEKRW